MRIAFVTWNPFQLLQFESIAKRFVRPTIFIIDKGANVQLFPKKLLNHKDWRIEYIKPADMPLIDGTHDAVLFQSAFPGIERLKRSRLVSIQYGLAKERHNYGEWRSLADLNLMYGAYSTNIVSHYAPSRSVGNPKFDIWLEVKNKYKDKEELYKSLALDLAKKTILYMPTWGDLGSFDELLEKIAGLQSKYNVLLKMHHNNDAKTPEWLISANRVKLKNIYDGSADQLKLLCAADIVVSDFSGAIFDGLYAEKPILLYQAGIKEKIGIQKFDLESLEFCRRDEIGYVCESLESFEDSIDYCLENSRELVRKAQGIRKELFHFDDDYNASELCVKYISELIGGQIPPLTKAQVYVREAVQSLRVAQPRVRSLEKQIGNLKKPIYKKILGLIGR
ncbi:CDP-glycerol glycerophosphotransferase family protein [Pseudomonas citronellolis]|uniref:CDP-glycerol glycerophosphotransferase family protein n=1 Tax=Pseudomonas citronellolis TaxID=53408 RepID=UPI002FD9C4D9